MSHAARSPFFVEFSPHLSKSRAEAVFRFSLTAIETTSD